MMVTTVEAAFTTLLGQQKLTQAQRDKAAAHVRGLKDFFSNTFVMADSVFAIGSYARGTMCAKERDVDLMASFSVADYWERYRADSRTFLYWVRSALNDRYAATTVSARQVAVRLDFSDIVVEIVPCFRRKGGGFLMPDGSRGWLATNPPFHKDLIASADVAHDGQLKPAVKLVKAWNIANGKKLRSFHVELMVERMNRGHTIQPWPTEVAALLKTMPSWLKGAFADPWSDGGRVDDYLSKDDREAASRLVEQDAERAAKAEEYRKAGQVEAAFKRWDVVFNGLFPTYG